MMAATDWGVTGAVRPGRVFRRDGLTGPLYYPNLPMLCSADMASKHWIRWLALVAGLAFVLRLVHLFELSGTPFATVLIGDAKQYDAWAQRLAAGDWLGTGVFYQAPLYPYLLGVVYAIVGHSLVAVRLIQAALGASACALLAVAGRRFVGARAGLIAGAMLAVYPPAIFFDGLLQKSSLDLFLVVLFLALLGEFMDRRRWPWLAGAGLALGAFMLNRENARVLYPVVLAWLWFFFRAVPARARVAWAAVFTLGVAAAVLPVGLRNASVGGEFLISTSQAGPNFYIGNHAGAIGSYVPLVAGHGNADFERDDATKLAEAATGRHLSPGEVSDYWLTRAVGDIRQAPGQWLALMGRKVLLTFNAAEVVDTESIEVYRAFSFVLDSRHHVRHGPRARGIRCLGDAPGVETARPALRRCGRPRPVGGALLRARALPVPDGPGGPAAGRSGGVRGAGGISLAARMGAGPGDRRRGRHPRLPADRADRGRDRTEHGHGAHQPRSRG